MRLRGALVVVTGAGSGIGRATALRFAQHGARVMCVDIDAGAAEKTAAACGETGATESAAYRVDVADADAMRALADRIHTEHGVLDVLVNNAGVGMSGRFADMSLDDWTWIRSINLDGVVHGCHAFGPAMVERGHGHVVNVSSGLGYTPRASEIGYVTTKAAVLAFTQCLRADWSESGVGVSAICPGVIDTPIVDRTAFLGAAAEDRARAKRLFGRGHSPDKVAKAIVRAVQKDKAVVPVGIEAWAGWFLHRYGPIGLQQRVARQRLQDIRALEPSAEAATRTMAGSAPFAVDTDDGASIAGEIAGDGPTVVLAHCWTGSRLVWQEVAEQLVASGHRVVLYDHRGHGASTSGTDGDTLDRLAKDLRAVLVETEATDVTLVGHSMGGMTIQQLAIDDPSFLAERVQRVVLVATSARGIRSQRISPIATRVMANAVTQRLMSSPRGDAFVRGAFGRDPRPEHMTSTRELFAACDPQARSRFLRAMHTMDLRGLAKVDVPVTVIAGARDQLTRPRFAREIAERLGAELHVLDDAGHMLPMERPDDVTRLIRGA